MISTLYVDRLGARLRYRLDIPESSDAALQEQYTVHVEDATLLALQHKAETLLRATGRAGFGEEARRLGSTLHGTLLPLRLREQLRRVVGPLLIATSVYGIPWELFHDGRECWGLRYAIGKRRV